MKFMKEGLFVAAVIIAQAALPSGFGLYEMSAASHAMGNAVIGRAVDGSANYFNPATLDDLKEVTVSAGFVTQHPHARMKVEGYHGRTEMDPGMFVLPHLQLAFPLPAGFTVGLGSYVECGLGSAYADGWPLVMSSEETTVESFTVNPNIAYAVNEDWSVGAGFRFFYFDFEQYAQPMPGRVWHRLKGDNSFGDWGWQVGTRYKVCDRFALGLVYKSQIHVDVEGKSQMNGAIERWVDASTEIVMPESITGGFNWDITRDWHLGGAFVWTKWSTFDTLAFNLGGAVTPVGLNWEDTYRVSIAPSWDFAEGWTGMLSYAYETDCTGSQDSTMLPRADRHLVTCGLRWRCLENLELSVSGGLIFMDGGATHATDAAGIRRTYRAHRGLCESFGLTLTYRF